MRKPGFAIASSGYLIVLVTLFSLHTCADAYNDALDDQLISAPPQTQNAARITALVKLGLSTIPRHIKRSLTESGYKILIVPMTEDVESPDTHPHGYADNRTWRNVDGAFASNKKQIIVAERVCRQSNMPVFNNHADETVRHEMGHAYDQYLGDSLQHKGNISASPLFAVAYNKDAGALTKQQRQEFHYFLQSGSAGAKELFAELFSALCSGGVEGTKRARRGKSLIYSFSTTTQLVKNLINGHHLQRFH